MPSISTRSGPTAKQVALTPMPIGRSRSVTPMVTVAVVNENRWASVLLVIGPVGVSGDTDGWHQMDLVGISAEFGSRDRGPEVIGRGLVRSQLALVAREYLLTRGWQTVIDDTSLRLLLGDEQSALLVPGSWAAQVRHRLMVGGKNCPIVSIPDETDITGELWGFLVGIDRSIGLDCPAPPGTRILLPGARMLLPPSVAGGREVRWICHPDDHPVTTATMDCLVPVADTVVRSWSGQSVRRRGRAVGA